MRNWLIVLALILGFHAAFGQDEPTAYEAAGKIFDLNTKLPIEGVLVQLARKDSAMGPPYFVAVAQTTTNFEGYFKLSSKEPADIIVIRGLGYKQHFEEIVNHFESKEYMLTPNPFLLMEQKVEAFANRLPNAQVPGTFGIVDNQRIRTNDQVSLQNALNSVPGVIMDSRGYGGSQRINIRGSFIRSPFAVRNVKTYINNIPISSPDGTSPLEIIDAFDVHSIEIVKGPIGSVYGSGTGGVIWVRAEEGTRRPRVLLQQQIGEYGIYRSSSAVSWGNSSTWHGRLSHIYQENKGYRDQEFNRKQMLTFTGRYSANNKYSLFIHSSYYNGTWGLPGGLTAAGVEEDPTAAIPFSVNNNAALYRERFSIGLNQEYRMAPHWNWNMSVYFNTTDKTNPYGTSAFNNGFKDEGATGFGGRTTLDYKKEISEKMELKLTAGGELQVEDFNIEEFTNVGGLPGDFKYSYDVDYTSYIAFAGAHFKWSKLNVFASGGVNNTIHNIQGYQFDYQPYDTLANWNASFLPRVAASFEVVKGIFVHAGLSSGNSNPTVFEQMDALILESASAAQVQQFQLRPEFSENTELGIKGTERKTGIQFEFTWYELKLSNAILPYTVTLDDPANQEYTAYSNSGALNQKGIEWTLEKTFFMENKRVHHLHVYAGGSFMNYQLLNYIIDEVDYSDKYAPGVPTNTVSSGLSVVGLKNRVRLSVNYLYMGETYLNYANTVRSDAYSLLNLRTDIRINSRTASIPITLFVGVNNALNTSYTSFFNLNAVGGRYFNPAPPMNFFGGIILDFDPRFERKVRTRPLNSM